MHQQPPKMPLLASTSAAKAGHVDSSRALTVYAEDRTSRSITRDETHVPALERHLAGVVDVGEVVGSRGDAMGHEDTEQFIAAVDDQVIRDRSDRSPRGVMWSYGLGWSPLSWASSTSQPMCSSAEAGDHHVAARSRAMAAHQPRLPAGGREGGSPAASANAVRASTSSLRWAGGIVVTMRVISARR